MRLMCYELIFCFVFAHYGDSLFDILYIDREEFGWNELNITLVRCIIIDCCKFRFLLFGDRE